CVIDHARILLAQSEELVAQSHVPLFAKMIEELPAEGKTGGQLPAARKTYQETADPFLDQRLQLLERGWLEFDLLHRSPPDDRHSLLEPVASELLHVFPDILDVQGLLGEHEEEKPAQRVHGLG